MPSTHQPTISRTNWAPFSCECTDHPWCNCLVDIAAPIVQRISRSIWRATPGLWHQYEADDFDQEIWISLMRRLPKWDKSRSMLFEKWVAYNARWAAREIRRDSARHYRIYIEDINWREITPFHEAIYEEKRLGLERYYNWADNATPEHFMLTHDWFYKVLEYAHQHRQAAVPYVEDMVTGYTQEQTAARYKVGREKINWWLMQCYQGVKKEVAESESDPLVT